MHARTTRIALLPVLLAIAGSTGCLERPGRPVSPCTFSSVGLGIEVESVDKVDLLFMVDNSNSMDQEQGNLTREFPSLARILATGDFGNDGSNMDPGDFQPVRDLNVGVVTSDMGTGGFVVPTCPRSDLGDDGVLRTQGNTSLAGCNPTYPAFLNFQPATGASPTAFANQFACVATVGTGGCGFEQQLEASLKAVMPSAPQSWTAPGFTPLFFFRNSLGHGDDPSTNGGFVRDNSVLGIIVVTDEEDGSAADPDVFNTMSAVYTEDLNLRQYIYDQAKYPTSRYVDGFLSLRRSAGLLVYAAITGIPVDLAPQTPEQEPNYDAILADSRMQITVDPAMPNRVIPSCDVVGLGQAYPPRRIVQVAQQLAGRGAGVTVQSICQNSFSLALNAIIRKIANALGQACLPRELNTNADGSVNCDVVATMPDGMDCGSYPGGCTTDAGCPDDWSARPKLDRQMQPVSENGRPVCTIRQRVPVARTPGSPAPAGNGWYYDTFTAEGMANCGMSGPWQRIGFTAQPPTGTSVRLECIQNVMSGTQTVNFGDICDPASQPSSDPTAANPCLGGELPRQVAPFCQNGSNPANCMTCDPVARTCGVSCVTDSDCRAAGLVGNVCDTRPKNVVDPSQTDTTPYNFCVNPTC